MRHFRKMIAVLLLMAVALLPAAGLGEGTVNALLTLRVLMETEFAEELPPAQGESIYGEADADTDNGIFCAIMYGAEEAENTIMIAGINDEGKYEIRTYPELSTLQMFYYTYLLSKGYSYVRSEVPADAGYTIVITFGDDEDMITIDNEESALAMADTVREALGVPDPEAE